MASGYATQNQLLLNNLLKFYNTNNNLDKILPIINGQSNLSIRIIDWFVTNYSKKNYVIYNVERNGENRRFKVYIDYKLKLKAYSKKRFDPFCRWDRINIPYKDGTYIQTTIGQLNFFKWALENNILEYIESNISIIEKDMNNRNSTSKRKHSKSSGGNGGGGTVTGSNTNNTVNNAKTRKKREELSVSAIKSIKKENVEIVVKFD
jgi:hypothetical protein